MGLITLRASKHIGTKFPPDEGKKLAEALIEACGDELWNDISIDLRRLPAAMLISPFFREFYHHLLEENSILFSKAKDFTWNTDHDFQLENINRWYEYAVGEMNIAQRSAQRLMQVKARNASRQGLSDFRDQCLDTANCKKNWPIWLAAFKDDEPMLRRLKKAMAKPDLDGLQDK